MDRRSIILERKKVQAFLYNVKFNKHSYGLYVEIVEYKVPINERLVFLMVCQSAIQLGFDGFLDELYIDVAKRTNQYIQQIILNIKKAFLDSESLYEKISNKIMCLPMTNREIEFKRFLSSFDFYKFISNLFSQGDIEKETKFKTICNEFLLSRGSPIRKSKIVPV